MRYTRLHDRPTFCLINAHDRVSGTHTVFSALLNGHDAVFDASLCQGEVLGVLGRV